MTVVGNGNIVLLMQELPSVRLNVKYDGLTRQEQLVLTHIGQSKQLSRHGKFVEVTTTTMVKICDNLIMWVISF
jgi:hypothetical protein